LGVAIAYACGPTPPECIMLEGAGTMGKAVEDRPDVKRLLSPKCVVVVLVLVPSCHEPRDRFD
jgi:hypothetical protein